MLATSNTLRTHYHNSLRSKHIEQIKQKIRSMTYLNHQPLTKPCKMCTDNQNLTKLSLQSRITHKYLYDCLKCHELYCTRHEKQLIQSSAQFLIRFPACVSEFFNNQLYSKDHQIPPECITRDLYIFLELCLQYKSSIGTQNRQQYQSQYYNILEQSILHSSICKIILSDSIITDKYSTDMIIQHAQITDQSIKLLVYLFPNVVLIYSHYNILGDILERSNCSDDLVLILQVIQYLFMNKFNTIEEQSSKQYTHNFSIPINKYGDYQKQEMQMIDHVSIVFDSYIPTLIHRQYIDKPTALFNPQIKSILMQVFAYLIKYMKSSNQCIAGLLYQIVEWWNMQLRVYGEKKQQREIMCNFIEQAERENIEMQIIEEWINGVTIGMMRLVSICGSMCHQTVNDM